MTNTSADTFTITGIQEVAAPRRAGVAARTEVFGKVFAEVFAEVSGEVFAEVFGEVFVKMFEIYIYN